MQMELLRHARDGLNDLLEGGKKYLQQSKASKTTADVSSRGRTEDMEVDNIPAWEESQDDLSEFLSIFDKK